MMLPTRLIAVVPIRRLQKNLVGVVRGGRSPSFAAPTPRGARIRVQRWRFFGSWLNLFDLAVTVLSLLPLGRILPQCVATT